MYLYIGGTGMTIRLSKDVFSYPSWQREKLQKPLPDPGADTAQHCLKAA